MNEQTYKCTKHVCFLRFTCNSDKGKVYRSGSVKNRRDGNGVYDKNQFNYGLINVVLLSSLVYDAKHRLLLFMLLIVKA